MSMRRIFITTLVAILFLSACNLPLQQPNPPQPEPATQAVLPPAAATQAPLLPSPTADLPTLASVPSPTAPSALTVELLKNAVYRPSGMTTPLDPVQLVDGAYQAGQDINLVSIRMGNSFAFGDLNGDGMQDGVAIVGENYGGSGVFVYLVAYLNQAGAPVLSAAQLIDDRPQVNSLQIENGQVILDALIHGVQDPMCCPSFPVVRSYRFANNTFIWTRQTSQTPTGAERAIDIDTPLDGALVSGSVQFTGRVAISPFENNLSYAIYDSAGSELLRGPFSVTSIDMGGPGTFDHLLDLSAFTSGTHLHVVLSDLSMADGSVLALASVELIIQ